MDIKLTLFDPVNVQENKNIYVNFDNVAYYHAADTFNNCTQIIFKNGLQIIVLENPEEICNKRRSS